METVQNTENSNVIDLGQKFISKKCLDQLKEHHAICDGIQKAIGALEIQKASLINQFSNVNNKINEVLDEAFSEIGLSPEASKECKIDIKTGEVKGL